MSSPSTPLPTPHDNTSEQPRFPCSSCPKTFLTIRGRHEHLLRTSHTVSDTIRITVPFYINLRHQNIKCPLCKFKSKNAKSPRSFISHFSRHLGQYRLSVAYTCSICSEVMPSDDVQHHLKRHLDERMPSPLHSSQRMTLQAPMTTYLQALPQPHPMYQRPKSHNLEHFPLFLSSTR